LFDCSIFKGGVSGIPAYTAHEDRTDNVPKRRHIKLRSRGITQKKEYNIQNMVNFEMKEIIVLNILIITFLDRKTGTQTLRCVIPVV